MFQQHTLYTSVYHRINSEADAIELQKDLDKLEEWKVENKMEILYKIYIPKKKRHGRCLLLPGCWLASPA